MSAETKLTSIAPSVLLPTLARLGLHTVADLVARGPLDWGRIPAVGRRKARLLKELYAEACRLVGWSGDAVSGPRLPTVAERLEAHGIGLDAAWDSVVRLAPARAHAGLREAGVTTLGELVLAVTDNRLRALDNFGARTLSALREQLDVIATHGHAYYLHGGAVSLDGPAALATAIAAVLDERSWHVLTERARERKTLDLIAAPLNVTRERVRQLEVRARDEVQRRFGEAIEQLARAALARLAPAAVIPIDQLASELGCAPGELRLLLDLAERLDHVWREGWLVTVPVQALEAALTSVRRALWRSMRIHSPASLSALLATHGLPVATRDAARFGAEILRLRWDDGARAAPSRLKVKHLLAELMDDLGAPATLDTITAALGDATSARGGDQRPTRRAVQVMLKSDPRIMTVGYSRYVHRDHAPVPAAALAAVVEALVARLRALPTTLDLRAYTAALRDQDTRLAALDWRMLHAELAQNPEVFVWHGSVLVGWRATVAPGWQSLRSLLHAAVTESSGPLRLRELARRLPASTDPAVVSTLSAQLREVLPLGRGRYLHRRHVALDDTQLDALVHELYQRLPPDGAPVGTPQVLAALRAELTPACDAALAGRDGAAILWGLGRTRHADLPMRFGAGLLVARGHGRGPLVDHCIRAALAEGPGLTKSRLFRVLRERVGYAGSPVTIGQRIDRMAVAGLLARAGKGWCVVAQPSGLGR